MESQHSSISLLGNGLPLVGDSNSMVRIDKFYSRITACSYKIDIYLPAHYQKERAYPLLLCNDGQDLPVLNISDILANFAQHKTNSSPIVVGVHANQRTQEYGIAHQADFAGRGAKAGIYSQFIIKELLVFLKSRYNLLAGPAAIMGFSLGGLSAMDIAWNFPDSFGSVGVFSGSFWWRGRDLNNGYTNADRIMHAQIRNSKTSPMLRFWLQTGTHDETTDRDNDGIIDSIGDTLDIISELKLKNYSVHDICYVEIDKGEHNQKTWGQALPFFLDWCFPS